MVLEIENIAWTRGIFMNVGSLQLIEVLFSWSELFGLNGARDSKSYCGFILLQVYGIF